MQDPSTNKARKTLLSETAEQVFQIGDLELPLLVPAYVTFSAPFAMFLDMSKITTSNTQMGHASFLRGFGLQALRPHGWSWCWNCFGHRLAALAIFLSQKLGTSPLWMRKTRPAEQALAETLLSRLVCFCPSWGFKIGTSHTWKMSGKNYGKLMEFAKLELV